LKEEKKMKRKKIIIMSVLFGCGLATAIFLHLGDLSRLNQIYTQQSTSVFARAVNSEIPQSIMPCLPKGERIKTLKFEAATQYQGKKYYLITVEEEVDTIFENDVELLSLKTVIQDDNVGCLVAMPKEVSDRESMTLYVPVPVARQLTLEFVKKGIKKAGGKEKFLQSFNEVPQDAADGPWIFFPEDIWVYEQLEMKLPQPSVVVNRDSEVKPPKTIEEVTEELINQKK
jgi:hypothetical protein